MALQNKKSLGQNWLKDRTTLDIIANLAKNDTQDISLCLEIGPGLGTLTSSLLKVFSRVVAVEYDEKLARNLPKSFPGKNLTVINEDFLQFNLEDTNLIRPPYIVAGNIPYYITSPIIEKLLSTPNQPERIVLLVQKEVAERIAAQKGDHSLLSLFVQNKATVILGPIVKKELFTPAPKVDSRIIIISPLSQPQISPEIFLLIRRGFAAPRKKLIKNLGQKSKDEAKKIFTEIGLSTNVRPSDLSLTDWQKLSSYYL